MKKTILEIVERGYRSMMKIKKRWLGIATTVTMFLSGCSPNQTYNKIKSQVQQSIEHAANNGKATINTGINYMLYKFATGCKAITPAVMTGSIAIGILILMIVKKDPVWRKRAIFLFILAIPIFMFVLSYGLAILLSIYVF